MMNDGNHTLMLPDGVGQKLLPPAVPKTYTRIPEVSEEPAPDSVGINHLMAALGRRKALIAFVSALGLSAGLMVALVTAPVYRARTSLQMEASNSNYFLRDVSSVGPMAANVDTDIYLQNQVKILESETLARRVADKLGLQAKAGSQPGGIRLALSQIRDTLGLRPQPIPPDEQRTRMVRSSLTVRTGLRSQVLEVFYDAPDPDLAARGANAAAAEYVALNREAQWQLAQDTTEWLRRQTADLKNALEKSGRELQDYARSSELIFAGSQSTLAEDAIRQIQDALTKAQSDRAAKQSRYEAVSSGTADSLVEPADAGPLREYQIALGTARRQLAELKTLYTPAHSKVKRLEAQIAEVEGAIAKERQQIVGRLRTDYFAAVRLERLLTNAYAAQLKKVQDQTGKATHYGLLKHESDTTQRLYDSMLQREKEAGAASALRATNVRLIDPARPPLLPYSPNYPLNSAAGLAMGLFFGLAIAIVREHSGTVKRPGDSRLLNLPELGVIPSAKHDRWLQTPKRSLITLKLKDQPLELVTWQQETSLLSESYRATLASILFSSEPRPRVLVVASVDEGEGKTTILTNLGIALSETHQRVLLIDGDLRRPRLHDVFNLCNDRGLTDLLQSPESMDGAPLDALARLTSIPDLWVLPTGPGTAAVSSLMYSPALEKLLLRFRNEFDLVLIDTPPLLLYSDARILGRAADGVVIVVRASKTRREQLKASYLRFLDDATPVLGTILNDWKIDHPGNYGSYGNYCQPSTRAGRQA